MSLAVILGSHLSSNSTSERTASSVLVLTPAKAAIPVSPFLLASFHLQMISHREYVRHAIRPDVDQILVRLIRHHSFQGHVSVLDDDVNRRQRPISVAGG